MAFPRSGCPKTSDLFACTSRLREMTPITCSDQRLLKMRDLAMKACVSDMAVRNCTLSSRFDEARKHLETVEKNVKELVELAAGHPEEEWIKYE